MGANAFAFPSGAIVATDEFVALCQREGIGAEAMEEILLLLHAGATVIPLADLVSSHPGLRERLEIIDQAQAGEE